MNIKQCEYLCEIAKTNSINAAAERLFVSHQSLSKSMRKLEEELDCTLFTRNSKGISLTEDGEFVLSVAQKITDAMQELNDHFAEVHNELHGELDFLSAPYPYRTSLLDTLRYFYRHYPNLKLNPVLCENPTLIAKLAHGEYEFGVLNLLEVNGVLSNELPDSLSFYETRRYRMYAICSPDYPLARYKRPSLKTLCRYPAIILPSSMDFQHSNSVSLLQSFFLDKLIQANSPEGFYQFIADGLGWGLVPEYTLSQLPSSLYQAEIKEHVYAIDGYIVQENATLSNLTQKFLSVFAADTPPQ